MSCLIEWTQLQAMHAATCARVLLTDAQLPCRCRTLEQMVWCHQIPAHTYEQQRKTMRAQKKCRTDAVPMLTLTLGLPPLRLRMPKARDSMFVKSPGLPWKEIAPLGRTAAQRAALPEGPSAMQDGVEQMSSCRACGHEILVVSQGQLVNRKQLNSPWRYQARVCAGCTLLASSVHGVQANPNEASRRV